MSLPITQLFRFQHFRSFCSLCLKLHFARVSIDKYTMVFLFCVKTLLLLEEDKQCSSNRGDTKHSKTCQEAKHTVNDDESYDGSTNRTCSPSYVASLDSHKFKRLLKPLEYWVANVTRINLLFCHDDYLLLTEQLRGRRREAEPELLLRGKYMRQRPS